MSTPRGQIVNRSALLKEVETDNRWRYHGEQLSHFADFRRLRHE
jgi:hypothetical protein